MGGVLVPFVEGFSLPFTNADLNSQIFSLSLFFFFLHSTWRLGKRPQCQGGQDMLCVRMPPAQGVSGGRATRRSHHKGTPGVDGKWGSFVGHLRKRLADVWDIMLSAQVTF